MKRNRRDFLKIMTSSALTASFLPLYTSCGEKKQEPEAHGVSQKNRAEEAISLMMEYNSCGTGMLAAYSSELGIDKDLAAAMGRGMAGGIGGLGNVCGAVSGAVMVIGLKTSNKDNIRDMEAGYKTMEIVQEFIARFQDRHSYINCRELIGHDISSKEKMGAAIKDNALVNCPNFIESAVTILDDMFSSEKV